MNWIFKNNTDNTIIVNNNIWKPGDEKELFYPVPSSSKLTCIQHGDVPEPVLFHDDFIIPAGTEISIELNAPIMTQNVALSVLCLTSNSGAECRFNSNSNNPIPIDVRDFIHVMPWIACSRIFLKNVTENDVHISVTAVEVVK